jgi:hypothetical protein
LPEPNPVEVAEADNLLPIKAELEDNQNNRSDIEMHDSLVTDVKIENQETTCRACLQAYATEENEKFFLNYTYINDVQLSALYNEYIGFNNANNESFLPTSICIECRNALLIFHDFRNQCRSNEITFMEAAQVFEENDEPISAKLDIEVMVDNSVTIPNYFDFEKSEVCVEIQNSQHIPRTSSAVEQQTGKKVNYVHVMFKFIISCIISRISPLGCISSEA